MLTVNIDIQDRLVNGQIRTFKHSEFAQDCAREVYVKIFDEQTGSKATRSSYLGRQNPWVAIEKFEAEISIKRASASPSIKHIQFPLALTFNGHLVQGLSLKQVVIDFYRRKQILFDSQQMCTALSRIKTYDNLYCIG